VRTGVVHKNAVRAAHCEDELIAKLHQMLSHANMTATGASCTILPCPASE
jgi:hypothetical protein